MSKLKSPQQKKAASLKRDRRNAYGEHSKGSRKSIPRGKARTERAYRHSVQQALTGTAREARTTSLDTCDKEIADARHQRKGGFHKVPDVPLGKVLQRKKERRERLLRSRSGVAPSGREAAAGVTRVW